MGECLLLPVSFWKWEIRPYWWAMTTNEATSLSNSCLDTWWKLSFSCLSGLGLDRSSFPRGSWATSLVLACFGFKCLVRLAVEFTAPHTRIFPIIFNHFEIIINHYLHPSKVTVGCSATLAMMTDCSLHAIASTSLSVDGEAVTIAQVSLSNLSLGKLTFCLNEKGTTFHYHIFSSNALHYFLPGKVVT